MNNLTEVGIALLELADRHGGAQNVVDACKVLWPQDFTPQRPDSFPARSEDRDTSQRSAAERATLDVGRFRAGSVAAQVLAVFGSHASTALDAARVASGANTPISTETARKRVSELVQAGFLVDTGHRQQSQGSPDEAAILQITQLGRQALTHLERYGWSK